MNKLFKKLMAVTIVLILVLSITACGDDSKGGDGGSGSPAQEPATQLTEEELTSGIEEVLSAE